MTTIPGENQRIELIDLLRGLAVIAMTVFHFTFDLELFGVLEQGFMWQAEWVYFARSIAGSFLMLAGVSLFLANSKGVNLMHWGKRVLKIVAAAGLITIATWFAIPDAFIFFGILHMIAFGSVVGLVFLRFPWWVTLAAAVGVFVLRAFGRTEILDAPFWWWTGLSQYTPNSVDYVPAFPWFGMVLLGIALAQILNGSAFMEIARSMKLSHPVASAIKFLGRNSLVYYLLHQPVMIALLYGVLKVF